MSNAAWAQSFADYVVERRLGAGAMGEVFLARDPFLDRWVAIKVIAKDTLSPHARERFVIEARAAARIQHPNVAAVYRAGEHGGQPFLVSEFVDGEPLDAMAQPMPYEQVLDVVTGLAHGLVAAHAKGVLHRDIKPQNVILDRSGRPKLVDFGLAKFLGDGDKPQLAVVDAEVNIPESAAFDETIAPSFDETMAPSFDETMAPSMGATIAPTGRGITAAGALLGTPDYMAPESWRGEDATPRTDLYALGVLMFELLTGATPFEASSLSELSAIVRTTDAPSLATSAVGCDHRFVRIVDRCLRREENERFGDAVELVEALSALKRRSSPIPDGNPYRGLRAFDSRHRSLFFGRTNDTERILDRLRTSSLLVVTGDSGTGKSSVVQAGVVPRLIEEFDGRRWATARMVPGRHPWAALVTALDAMTGLGAEQIETLARDGVDQLATGLRRKLGSERGLIVLIDQLEEICTQSDPAEARCVADVIARFAHDVPGIRVIATLRADFLTRVAAVPRLGECVARAIHVLGPLDDAAVRDVIVGPARVTNVTFESESLVDQLVAATGSDKGGSLPLLQFALERLWELRDTTANQITSAALDSLGGVAGALAQHADEVIAGLPRDHRKTARQILVRLTNAEGVRVARSIEALIEPTNRDENAVLEALVGGRLIVVHEHDDETAYELAHEVLIDGWSTLRRWRTEDEDVRAAAERLRTAVSEWHRLERDPSALWSAPQLVEIDRLIERMTLTDESAQFLDASRRRRRRARNFRIARYVAPPFIVAVTIVGAMASDRIHRDRRADRAMAEGHQKHRQAVEAVQRMATRRSIAFRQFDRGDLVDAETNWADAIEASVDAEKAYRSAMRAVEEALAERADRPDIIDRFAGLLFERAVLADELGYDDRRNELLERLALYDHDGRYRERWNAPARVRVTGSQSAELSLIGYDETFRPVSSHLARGEDQWTLASGSNRLTVRRSGHETHYPFIAKRGAALTLDVSVPPIVPPGFIYIPPGVYTYGSTADEESRRGFFDAVPAHPLALEPFFVARYETTFADWIRFLEALPPAERISRSPGQMDDAGLTSGALALARIKGKWSIRFRPSGVTYEATDDERIRYPARSQRAVQDWTKMPVTGISANDAEAYAAWLRSTGEVVGARLCTEREWERAARGADARPYPHSNVLEKDHINYDQTYDKAPGGMGPDEVGSHPESVSPFGVHDLSGNAFEWTTAVTSTGTYVLRGGSYYYDAKTNRVTNRAVAVASLRVGSVGLRLCASIRKEQVEP